MRHRHRHTHTDRQTQTDTDTDRHREIYIYTYLGFARFPHRIVDSFHSIRRFRRSELQQHTCSKGREGLRGELVPVVGERERERETFL